MIPTIRLPLIGFESSICCHQPYIKSQNGLVNGHHVVFIRVNNNFYF
jgi:hypothetical protein